jgi:hypothetical protein
MWKRGVCEQCDLRSGVLGTFAARLLDPAVHLGVVLQLDRSLVLEGRPERLADLVFDFQLGLCLVHFHLHPGYGVEDIRHAPAHAKTDSPAAAARAPAQGSLAFAA